MDSLIASTGFFSACRAATAAGDRVLVHGGTDAGPGYNDYLIALDRETGDERWRFGGRARAFDYLSPIAVHDGLAFVGRADGSLTALDLGSGEVRYQIHIPGGSIPTPLAPAPAPGRGASPYRAATTGGALLVASNGWLHRLAPATGALLDRRAIEDATPAVTVQGAGTLWLSSRAGRIARLDAADLTEVRARMLDGPLASPALVAGNRLVLHLDRAPLLVCDLDEGRTVDRLPPFEGHLRPCTDGQSLFTATRHGFLVAWSLADLRPRWEAQAPEPASIAVEGGLLCAETRNGVMLFDAATGALRRRIPLAGDEIAPVSLSGGVVYAQRGDCPTRVLCAIPVGALGPAWRAGVGGYALT